MTITHDIIQFNAYIYIQVVCKPILSLKHRFFFFLNSNLQLLEIGRHTSELQSRQYLVCRLLLEKKKKDNDQ